MRSTTRVARLPLPWWASLLATGLVAGTLAALAGTAGATPPPPPPPQVGQGEVADDPPGRVGRVADLNGTVWLFSPETGEWVGAERNRVLTTGDRVATDANGRAELRIGSTVFRLDGGAEIEFDRIDDERIDLRLHSGDLAMRIRNREVLNDLAVITGEGRFTFQRTGRYRVDRADEASHLTVLAGQGMYEGPRSALTVNAGQRAEFWIDAAGVAQYSIVDPRRDEFAAWNAERDRADDRSASQRYVSPEMTGVEDLDRYGRWENSDEYGALWVPYRVAPGWAPYSTGRWAWVRPWGWTWVDEAPWGFAPFHYGRWVLVGARWCWAPGQYVRRPVWAPALVAWVGGPGLNISVNIGVGPPVGWFPLAPREVYVPGYRVSPIYIRNVNVTHVTNVTVIDRVVRRPPTPDNPYDYRYRKFPNAVTVVPSDVITSRRPVAPIAAQMRERGVVREVVEQRSRAPINYVAPVAAPAAPVATGPASPPPARMQIPERTQREREDRDRRADDNRRVRVPAPVQAEPPQAPVQAPPSRAINVRPSAPAAPVAPASPAQPRRAIIAPEPHNTPPADPVRRSRPAPAPNESRVAPPTQTPAPQRNAELPSRVRHLPQPALAAPPAAARRAEPPAAVVRAQPEPRKQAPSPRDQRGEEVRAARER